mmetsp:Transcript_15180/g.22408  ORF Transcript_15180/g.22408 Transcript_15180/m.22408 type:complete len:94 (-) Transcript_15180:544-825(-)
MRLSASLLLFMIAGSTTSAFQLLPKQGHRAAFSNTALFGKKILVCFGELWLIFFKPTEYKTQVIRSNMNWACATCVLLRDRTKLLLISRLFAQ